MDANHVRITLLNIPDEQFNELFEYGPRKYQERINIDKLIEVVKEHGKDKG